MLLLGVALAAEPPAEVPYGPEPPPALVFGPRQPLVALEDRRHALARDSAAALLIAASAEVVAGVAVVVAEGNAGDGLGIPLVVGGAAHGVVGVAQLQANVRRHAAFDARAASLAEAPDEAWLGLAEDGRMALERDARAHAFATGAFAVVGGLGALGLVASSDPRVREGAAGLSFVGALGALHHGTRWRADVRVATDLAVLRTGVPTVLPDQGER